ncbi:class I SAM-dependent methyltransferase [Lutibacter sp.]|uniref:class I SAM-dependent methyltransferase n=1 Tax=Lutibacter sp. TaxID=1925666 RepID=UPI0025BAADF9|nr:class I SAM-dependent methyltransferase [Lutibacter sp.]
MKTDKKPYLICLDYTVSHKKFELQYNATFDMLETIPKPPMEELDSYYESSEYISHTDSKKSIIDKVYQIVKKYTLNKKLKLINSFNTETKNLLDVGCGTGDFLATCNSNGWNVVGVEPNQSAKNLARQKISSSSKIHQNIFEIKLERFDVITLWHVLEHVPDLEEYISQLQKLLKPNGVLVVAVPNYKSFDAIHYKQFWAAYDVPRHLWHFSKKSIQLLFSKHKMRVSKILPMKFDAFYVSLLSEKYKTGKSNFLTAFFVGMQSNLKAMNKMNYSSLIYVIKSDKKSF